jgi:sugar/nucleoside kinase (ribokinase family)
MLVTRYKDELLSFLKETHKKLDVVVMPDFFLDRLINLNCDAPHFSSMVANVANRKGGSIDGIAQTDIRGGNAINTASALAALEVKVMPIVCTNKLGLQQINFYLKRYRVDTSHIKLSAKASITTALELKTENGKANVMLRDVGSLADFSPSDLTDEDYALIENADYVCLFNWAGTKKFGTELAETVFRRAKTKGKCKAYFDTADPTPNKAKIPELMEKVLKTSQVDILSLNENEAVCYAALLDAEINAKRTRMRFDELAMEAARVLAKHLSARIDLHTTEFSATVTKKHEVVVPAFKVKTLRATGAGDAWNAGNILGDGNALSDECRIALANAVAACYLSDPEGMHPTRQKLVKFIENSAENSHAPR